MPITTQEQEYIRLRSYLNPSFNGPNTDAILNALAFGASSYLINNLRAINDQLYIATASGTYLDQRLAESEITRPPAVGLSDDVFRHIGIQVKNRKQVRDLINNLLDAIFGDQFVKATNSSGTFEPYDLTNGDTLIVNFDGSHTVSIVFNTNEFENIAAAKAQEVADAITAFLSSNGFKGTAIAKNNGNGNFVEIISSTIGPASSVTIMGGSAQNELLFPSPVPASGNASTQWTLSLQPGGFIRFTWSGGANPNLGKVSPGNYVNIFGGGFASSANEGSYTIVTSVGGPVNQSYFEIENPLGTSGIVTQGTDNAVLFFNPVKRILSSNTSYASVYQTQSGVLQIFLPAATQVIRRSRIGSAHLHYPPFGTFIFNSNPSAGDQFSITSTSTYIAGTNFAIGATIDDTIQNFVNAVNAGIPGLVANAQTRLIKNVETGVAIIQSDSLSLTLTMSYTGSQSIIGSGPQGDVTSLEPNQQGPYGYDLTQPFTVSHINTTLNQNLNSTNSRVIQVTNSTQFPDSSGYIILGYGTQEQEGPIPYIARPSDSTLLISPVYTIQQNHTIGSTVTLVASKAPVVIATDGTDYPFFITGVAEGRIYAQNLIQSVAATGIKIVFTILYPSDYGLGKWGTIYTENPFVWGP